MITSSYKKYRISFNNSQGRLFLFQHQKGAIIRGRRLFQILLTGSRALNILLYYPIKSKNYHIKKTEHGSLITFQSLNHHWSVLLDQIPLQLDREGIKGKKMARRVGRGDYSREAIILNISIKEGWGESIIRRRWSIEGRLLFEEIRSDLALIILPQILLLLGLVDI